MRRAKILLTAITIFAVVGGALAFKTSSALNGKYFCQTFEGSCVNTQTFYKIVAPPGGSILYCNTGTPSDLTCNNQHRVAQDAH